MNLTQRELAARSGVTFSSLKRFEREGLIALDSLLNLALVLNCLDDFDKLAAESPPISATQSLDALLARRRGGAERRAEKDAAMAYSPTELLTVYLDARDQRRKIGRLAFKERQILFEYDASFITSGIEIRRSRFPSGPACLLQTPRSSTACSAYSMTACRTDGAAFCSTARWKNTVFIAAN